MNILWFSGVQIILFLAGLQKINKEVYEAASIDGASPWESFWKITLPSLKPIILVSSIYTIVMLSTFSTNSVLYRINVVRQQSFGQASALSWVYFIVIGFILGIVTFILVYEKKTKEKKQLVEVKR
jgi:ABC-type sugar transport system permease subunit